MSHFRVSRVTSAQLPSTKYSERFWSEKIPSRSFCKNTHKFCLEKNNTIWMSLLQIIFDDQSSTLWKTRSGKGTRAEFFKIQISIVSHLYWRFVRHHISTKQHWEHWRNLIWTKEIWFLIRWPSTCLNAVENNPEAKGFIFDSFPERQNKPRLWMLFWVKNPCKSVLLWLWRPMMILGGSLDQQRKNQW